MTGQRSGRPQAGEYAAYMQAAVDAVPEDDAVAALRASAARVDAFFAPLRDGRLDGVRPAPGKWTVKELLGHLIDDERIYAYRALCLARGDERPLAGFDQDRYVAAARSEARPLDDLLAEYRLVRAASVALFTGLEAEAWDRRGTSDGHPVSVRGLAYHIVAHERHHLAVLHDRYLPRVAAEPA